MLGFYAEYGVNTYKNTPIYSRGAIRRVRLAGVSTYKNAPIYSYESPCDTSDGVSTYKNAASSCVLAWLWCKYI
jgi:hypothetical protein